MMERTGFSADQGSMVDSSLNLTGSSLVPSPPAKYQRLALCVVPDSGLSASSNALHERVEEDDDNVSRISSSTSSQLIILEAAVKARRAKLAEADAIVARNAIAAQLEEDNLFLIKAKLESSNRSNASSRRSGRRPANDEGKRVEPIMDFCDGISRDLSRLFDDEDMFAESPIRIVEEAQQQKNDERASTLDTASTAESAGLLKLSIVIAPTSKDAGVASQAAPSSDPPITNPTNEVFVIGTPGNSTPEARVPELRVPNPQTYGPLKGSARRSSPFNRRPSTESPQRTPTRVRETNQTDVNEQRERACAEVRDEAVMYLQELQTRMMTDHQKELLCFEAEAERKHEMIMSSNQNMMTAEQNELNQMKARSIEAERDRLRLIAERNITQAKAEAEQIAARKIAEFEGHMVAAQQDTERARHEAAMFARERDAAMSKANDLQREEQEAKRKLYEQTMQAFQNEEAMKAEARRVFEEMETKIKRLEAEKESLKAKSIKREPTPETFFIGDAYTKGQQRRPNRDESRGRTKVRDKVKITILKPPRPPARSDSSPSSSESYGDHSSKPGFLRAATTTTTKTRTKTATSSSHRGPPGPDPGDDDEFDGQEDDRRERREKKRRDEKRGGDGRKPPKPPPRKDDGGDDGDDDDDSDGPPPFGYDDDYDSSGSSDDDAEKLLRKLRRRRNGKEADKIILPAISNAAAFRAWRVTARTNVVAASGKGEHAFLWIMEVENPEVSFKRLYNTGSRFSDLDAKLLSAVTDKAHGELGREITQKIEEFAKVGRMLRGRQALRMIYNYMKVSEQAGALFDISDLMNVRLQGDRLETFLHNWESTLTGMKNQPDPETKEVLFFRQLQRSDSLKAEVAHYERHELGHPDHSYNFLLTSIKRKIQKRRQDDNRKTIEHAHGGGKSPALPAQGKGKGENNKGICYRFRDTGKCDRENCPYSHGKNAAPASNKGKGKGKRGRSKSPNGSRGRSNTPRGRSRSNSPGGRSNSRHRKKQQCWHFQNGKCKYGDKCFNLHGTPAAPASQKKKNNNKKKKQNKESDTENSDDKEVVKNDKTKNKSKVTAAPAVRGPPRNPLSRALFAASMIATAMSYQIACPAVCFPNQFNQSGLHSPCLPCINNVCSDNLQSWIEPINKSVTFGTKEVFTIDGIGYGYSAKPKRRREGYHHSEEVRNLRPTVEERKAVIRACWWHEQMIENEKEYSQVKREALKLIASNKKNTSKALAATANRPRKWLADTGSASDLVSAHEVDKRSTKRVCANEIITLYTANGPIEVDRVATTKIGSLGKAEALILDETPAVFSVGKRVMHEGFSFIWRAGKRPYMTGPNNTKIELEVEGDIPYLIDNSFQISCVAEEIVEQVEPADPGDPSAVLQEPAEVRETKDDRLKKEATSIQHLLTHMPQNPFCATCRISKLRKASARKIQIADRHIAKTFGERVHADHVFPKDVVENEESSITALALKDDSTEFRGFYPQSSKGAEQSAASIRHFIGPRNKLGTLRTDNSKELIKSAKNLKALHETSTPYRSESNGRIERDIGVEVGGIRCNLTQSGLPLSFWPQAGQHFAHYTNCIIPCREGNSLANLPPASLTPWQKRFKEPWAGPTAPFGCLIRYRPYNANETLPKYAPRTVEGLFMGVYLHPGHTYSGDVLVIPLDVFQASDDSQSSLKVNLIRVKEAECRFPLKGEDYKFPVAEARKLSSIAKIRLALERSIEVSPELEEIIDDETTELTDQQQELDLKRDSSAEESTTEESGGSSSSSSSSKDVKQDDSEESESASERHSSATSSNLTTNSELQSSTKPERLPKGPVGRPATKRPPHWKPDAWAKLSKKQRDRETEIYNRKAEDACPVVSPSTNTESTLKPNSDVMTDDQFRKTLRNMTTASLKNLVYNGTMEQLIDAIHKTEAISSVEFYEAVPAMPVITATSEHREKLQTLPPLFNACVARSVTKAEIASSAKGREAQALEWSRLRKIGAWDEKGVREWSDVVAEARKTGKRHHVGRVFEVNVMKGDELPEGDPNRKYKCRVVFQGNNVRDANSQQAVFLELSSCPATMEAAKAADIYGLIEGHGLEQSDAEQAYVQAKLGGKLRGGAKTLDDLATTWIRLPREQWPKEWNGMVDPVCPLLLALYGHPEAGGWWEDHSKEQLESVGFREIPDWKSCFWHDKLKLFLVVYVDDFKLSGPKNALPIGWSLIRSKIKTDDPTPAGRYLGCDHLIVEKFIPKDKNPFATAGGNLQQEEKIKVRAMIYNMSNFLKSCVDRYLELAKCDKSKLKKVATPFLDDNKIKRDEDDDDLIWPLSASGKKTKNINTKGEDHSSAGTLADIACKVLMKVLYAARMARYDLLKAVSLLASRVTKWDKTCDLELHRLMCYINSTLDLTLISYVGDPIDALEVRLYTDADFAGDSGNSRSTSGTFLCISGPHSSAPLSGQSKKQTAVSHSTPEAEIISADHGVRNSGLPAIGLWEVLLGKKLVLKLEEDNSAAKRVAETGRNPTMRHLNRTHKVDLRFLHEQIENGNMIIVQCPTDRMCADIFTKSFTNAEKWYHACNLIGHVYPSQINWIDHRSDKICGNHRPATPATPRYDRVIIEFCCGNQSRIGNWADKFEGCKSRRLTIEEDMTTESG